MIYSAAEQMLPRDWCSDSELAVSCCWDGLQVGVDLLTHLNSI